MDIYKLMKLLSDKTRMKILFVIFQQPSYVNEIVEVTDQSQANISKHLKKLRELGLVEDINEGTKVKYSINECFIKECRVFTPLMEMYHEHPDGKELLNKLNCEKIEA